MIDALLAFAGVDCNFVDAFGAPAVVSDATKFALARALGYDAHDDATAQRALQAAQEAQQARTFEPCYVVLAEQIDTLPPDVRLALPSEEPAIGYYDVGVGGQVVRVIVVPSAAYRSELLDERPGWGFAAQLYSLRTPRDWGIGDFSSLADLARAAAKVDASVIGLNPLHQLHVSNPTAASPYAPLSRRFLNVLYIDVDVVAREFDVSLDDIDRSALRAAATVDYAGVTRAKIAALERIYDAVDTSSAVADFERMHPAVRTVALYETIMEQQREADASIYSWQQWPAELHDVRGPHVARFERENARRVAFYIWLQSIADAQLARCATAAALELGLYRDLAVGVDISSADVWSDPDAFALELSIGAPPDPLNAAGQNWGLPPFHPRALAERGYAPLVELLRANMRHAGALRIDHVMGLKRLFVIARETGGGAYLNYDFEAMLGIVALESVRHGCVIVGEDLGTVPDGFRERIASARISSCRVLYFDPPFRFPADSVASTGTHDLPTLAGWRNGDDIAIRRRLGWIDDATEGQEREQRREWWARLVQKLIDEGVLATDVADEPSLFAAVFAYLARARSRVVLLSMEDAVASREQVNVPGTIDEEPNWRRRLPIEISALREHPVYRSVVSTLRKERP